MIHEAIDRVHTTLKDNFNTDYAAALPAGGPALTLATTGGLQSTGDFFKRLAAEVFGRSTQFGIGVYQDPSGGRTNARRPGGIRDTTVVVLVDFHIRGDNPDDVAVQTEVAIDAIVRSADRMLEADANGVRAAGAERDSIAWDVDRTPLWDDVRIPQERAKVRIPMVVRDTGL